MAFILTLRTVVWKAWGFHFGILGYHFWHLGSTTSWARRLKCAFRFGFVSESLFALTVEWKSGRLGLSKPGFRMECATEANFP